MGQALQGPEAQLARFRRRTCHAGRPAAGSRLLLHNAEVGTNAPGLCQVQRPLTVIQISFFPVIAPLFKDLFPVQSEPKVRIGIVHHQVQNFTGKFQIVQVVEKSVGRDEIAVFHIRTDSIRLVLCKTDGTVRDKTIIVQHLMGIMAMV